MRFAMVSILILATPAFAQFKRSEIATFPKGYQVAAADVNGDGRLDVIAVSSDESLTDWFENPTWKARPVARLNRSIDIAPHDLDGDGRPEIAIAGGFYFSDGNRGGEIQWFERPSKPGEMWRGHPIAVDPVVHRIMWGDLDGDGRKELVHAPIFGRGSRANIDTKPVHFWAFRPPADLESGTWEPWKIDETLTVLHGIYVGDVDGDGRDEVLTASFEGIHRYDFEGSGEAARWKKTHFSPGGAPESDQPGAKRGTSEVAHGRLKSGREIIAAVEPWHGDMAVVYVGLDDGAWTRRILDDTIRGGHAVVIADFDADGSDEIIVGWRRGDGGLAIYDSLDSKGNRWKKTLLDSGVKIEDAIAVDINRDGRLDIVVAAKTSDRILLYENTGPPDSDPGDR